jgi:hypothetical protein
MSVTTPGEVAHSGLRGAIAAMAMTGMRAFTFHLLYGFVLSETRARPRE